MSVVQADEEELILSKNASEALKDFAREMNIGLDTDSIFFRKNLQTALDTTEREHEFDFSFGGEIEIKLLGMNPVLGQTLSSTGLTVWASSQLLSRYLFSIKNQLVGKNIIELGAGLGLCGLLVAHVEGVRSVVLTDGGEEFTEEAYDKLHLQVKQTET